MNDFLKNLRSAQTDNKQRPVKKRKNFSPSYHYSAQSKHSRLQSFSGTRNAITSHNRKHEADKTPIHQGDPVMSLLADAVDKLSSLVDVLVKNQEHLTAAQKKANDTLERQTSAIEKIVGYLNFFKNGYPEKSYEQEKVYVKASPVISKSKKKQAATKIATKKDRNDRIVEHETKILKKKKSGELENIIVAQSPDKKLLNRKAVMEIIRSMREKNAPYDEVAAHLISLGQPTFSGRGEWHAQTIHRLYTKK